MSTKRKAIKKDYNPIIAFFDKYQSFFSIILFFIVWELAVRIFDIPEIFLSSPSNALYHLFVKQPDANYHWKIHILATLKEFLVGFAVSAFFGVLIAVLLSWSKKIQKVIMPFILFFHSMPMVGIVPIVLLWMGYGFKTNIFIAFVTSFFPMVINTLAGLNSVDGDLLDLVGYLNASKIQVFWKIRLPSALPYIFSSLKICTSLVVMGVIVGELYASDRGLGFIISNAEHYMDTPPMFAALIIMSLLSWGMFLVVSTLERICMPWKFMRVKE